MRFIWSGLKRTYNFFANNSSLHGILYTSSKWPKLYRFIWIVVILLSFLGSTYLSWAIWLRFIGSPIRISIVTQFSPTSKIPFPAVTVCPANIMKNSTYEQFLDTLTNLPEEVTYDNLESMVPLMLTTFPKIKQGKWLIKLSQVLQDNRYTIKSARDLLGQTCEELLVKCIWEGEEVDCKSIFADIYTFQGKCCVFNSAKGLWKPLFTKYFGFEMGLSIIMNTMVDDSLVLTNGGGISINVHEPNSHPVLMPVTNLALPGHETFIAVEGSSIISSDSILALPIEDRECIYPDERQLRFMKRYQKMNCDAECYMNVSLSSCNCIPYYFNVGYGYKECEPKDSICIVMVFVEYLSKNSLFHEACGCFAICSTTMYRSFFGTSKLEGLQFVRNSLYSNLNVTKSTVIAHIAFKKQTATIQNRDIVVNWQQILCNLGGVFSLFLGFSFITVIEILFTWTLKLRHEIMKRKK